MPKKSYKDHPYLFSFVFIIVLAMVLAAAVAIVWIIVSSISPIVLSIVSSISSIVLSIVSSISSIVLSIVSSISFIISSIVLSISFIVSSIVSLIVSLIVFSVSVDIRAMPSSSSVGVDIAFVGSRWVFGIPEHSESYALRDTVGFEPYRLYNLDVFEYEYHSPMALYGSIPYLVGTNSKRTTGMLWLNAAETWVDIQSTTADKGFKTSLSKEVLDADTKPRDVHVVNTRFISETGLIDIFLTLGPAPHDSYRQLAHLLGTYPLPPYFSLGYHQSRWNYIDQKDVKQVHDNFEKHEIPLDVIWLDIDHTDKKAYFTWCKENFSDPLTMINDLTEKGRKLVTIVDPHVKKDSKYFLYKESKQKKLLVKAHDGTTFEGNCWPGDSVYIDFTNPKAREYWASRFAFDKYVNTTKDVHIWNDMNEPSVFNGPEGTMPKDAEHYNGLEHREVHNMYGFYQHEATYDGLIKRTNGEYRPFVLSRAFFAGSQRTAAVWTGDNKADWHHYRVSIPMLLSLSTAGIPHIGADVGGFMGDPDDQLLIRWYQAGAFQPFFRGHSHQNTKRREPWLFSQNVTDAIRKAIQWRYKIIPYLYTLFYEHSITGKPVMRSLWMEFRDDETSYDEDRQWMLGNALVVKPLQDPEAQVLSMYLPGTREIWYEWTTGRARPSPGAVQSDKTDIGLYQRGGTIVVARENVKLTAAANKEDPVVLYIASNRAGDHANGTLYIDDGETFKYRDENDYAYWGFHFKKKHDFLYTITNENLAKKGKFDSDIYIEKIYLRGTKFHPRTCHIFIDGKKSRR
ncbi:hypothetical protein WR25_09916 isoform F [Diploscapter pachys]|uniref:Uncharacterized protein n=1 Tax=Diploscapter pachys TaxID=2018661 RepID=A0A2A2JYE2_9BILA|nr:hypothetical protein WR25_09916 isoform F [Diploscapter pachys]